MSAVWVRDACKWYGKDSPVLNHLDMSVPHGVIYSLLGSSGCGKTTLLSCIVGLRKLTNGQMSVLGTKVSALDPRTVGFMPQEVGLQSEFTIEEVLRYFGRLYGMSEGSILDRIGFLVQFLQLPKQTQLIHTLSGGEQRRVSLAVAMIHEPRLLILDEPTVGLDPLIRHSIWEYLLKLVSNGDTTIIITTHYIEEARKSHVVGVLRDGRLLAENDPQKLLQEHNATLLERVVLQLCKGVEHENTGNRGKESPMQILTLKESEYGDEDSNVVMGLKFQKRSPDKDYTLRFPRMHSIPDRNGCRYLWQWICLNIQIIFALVHANLLTLIRHPIFLLILLIMPSSHIQFVHQVVGGEPQGTTLAVVNHEVEYQTDINYSSCYSASNESEIADFIPNQTETSCRPRLLSCAFLRSFHPGQIEWNVVKSEVEALESVQLGLNWGYVVIPQNFSEFMEERAAFGNFAINETLLGSTISVALDYSSKTKSAFIVKAILDGYMTFVKTLLTNCGEDSDIASIPIKYNAMYGSTEVGWAEFAMPNAILGIMLLIPMGVGITMVLDKKRGVLDRSVVAGMRLAHLRISVLISHVLVICVELGLCLTVAVYVFNFQILGSVVLVFLLSSLMGLAGLSYGFFLGVVCAHEVEVIIAIICLYTPTCVSSGGGWTLEGIAPWMIIVAKMLPLTLTTVSLRNICNKGWFLTHPQVWPGFATVIGWILICSFGSMVFRQRKYH